MVVLSKYRFKWGRAPDSAKEINVSTIKIFQLKGSASLFMEDIKAAGLTPAFCYFQDNAIQIVAVHYDRRRWAASIAVEDAFDVAVSISDVEELLVDGEQFSPVDWY